MAIATLPAGYVSAAADVEHTFAGQPAGKYRVVLAATPALPGITGKAFTLS